MNPPDNFMPGLKINKDVDVAGSIKWLNEVKMRFFNKDMEGLADCDKAPEGWKCSRHMGHDGPCAARPAHDTTLLVWQDLVKRETTVYAFSEVPDPVRVSLWRCHGHMDDGSSNLPFHIIHSYIATKEDCRIEEPFNGPAMVFVMGIL